MPRLWREPRQAQARGYARVPSCSGDNRPCVPSLLSPSPPPIPADRVLYDTLCPHDLLPVVDEALKLNIQDKDDTSPRRPSTKRAHPAEEKAQPAAPAESSSPEASGRPKRKAAPAPTTEAPVKGRGKKAKTDAA